ncbi:hypothetical protein CDAR_187591 [Caerostris darwini]|uniref:Uncharacterized protein n=1 Tax=Caerostris darwini TaxID=1538125 RepID=A0AAV4SXI7_9ARAC|nr:hypothetical protein CDAR_187591 [Caerostris darwini]
MKKSSLRGIHSWESIFLSVGPEGSANALYLHGELLSLRRATNGKSFPEAQKANEAFGRSTEIARVRHPPRSLPSSVVAQHLIRWPDAEHPPQKRNRLSPLLQMGHIFYPFHISSRTTVGLGQLYALPSDCCETMVKFTNALLVS